MNKEYNINVVKSAHKKYVDWWLPIDVAAGSILAPMACHLFYETLLVYDDNWWNRWLNDYNSIEDKTKMKRIILKFIIGHYLEITDLNKEQI